MKLMIIPRYDAPDKGDGGIRRVVEAQQKYLPQHGFEFVWNIADADIVATHAAEIPDVPVGKPWVIHTHGLYWAEYEWPSWGDRVNAALIEGYKRADAVTTPSEWVAYALQRGMWLRPTVLPHGIEPDEWYPGTNNNYVLWNKARTDPISDPEPMQRLSEMALDVKFMSTFGQPSRNVHITGKKSYTEAKKDIQNAEVYLCTARETFGIGTLEAMACAVPVLAWNWGGQREIIKHGVTGYLANVGDYEDLKRGLYWCLQNRDKIGHAAREDVLTRFTWDVAIARYAKLYYSVYGKQNSLNNGPKVSIITPCYNLAKYLPDTIHSVLDQTMKNWEMIIVDDCSTDDTQKVAKKYTKLDPRIKLVKTPVNTKLPGALNYGFAHAQGRYVMNLDADNMITPTTLKVLSDALDNNRAIHIAYGRIKFALEDGVTPNPVTGTEDGVSTWPPDFSAAAQFTHKNQIPSTSLCRREVYERTGGYRERAKVAEDAEFWTRAVSYGFQPAKVTKSVTLIYREHANNKSHGESEPDWTSWLPWTKDFRLAPWGCAAKPIDKDKRTWPVPTCEPALVTMIIPVGPGHEKIVIDALDSIEAQTFRHWDCIVINDTGKELTVPHPWVKMLHTKGGTGPGNARNVGIAASKTKAFVCLDADDIMEPDCLKEFYSVWNEIGGVVYSQWWDDKGDKIKVWNPPAWIPEKLITDGCIHASCAMYEKKLWEAVGGFDPSMKNWEDWDFQIAYALKGFCAYKINRPLFTYRKTKGARREDAAFYKDRGEKEMRQKWPTLWDGQGKEMIKMACGSCGNKVPRPHIVQAVVVNSSSVVQNGATLLEYTGVGGKSTWIGKVTGKKYFFGNDEGHKRMFVYNADVDGFLKQVTFKVAIVEQKPVNGRPVLAGVMEG